MVAPLKALLDANPDLRGGLPPAPFPGAGLRMPTVRAQTPGGELMKYVPQDGVLWFEQLFRVLPPDGMYDATPSNPLTFGLGSFKVPQSMVLVVIDYAFDIYRFSGASADDYLPIEERRLSTQVGWDININNNRPANLNFQILPKVPTQTQQAFAALPGPNQPAQQWQFDAVRASQLQVAAGPGLALLPQRPHRDGQVPLSNTYVARSSQTLNVACSVINRIPIPIAFFEGNICGVLLPQNVYDRYEASGVPIGDPLLQPIPGAP
jgi:hypothetical protein